MEPVLEIGVRLNIRIYPVFHIRNSSNATKHQFLLDPLLEVGREACGIFEEAIKAFFAKDVISANKIIDLQVKIEELNREIIEKTMEEKRASIVCATCSLSDSIARIAEYGAEVAEVTINRVIGRE